VTHDDEALASLLFIVREASTEDRRYPQKREEVRRDSFTHDTFRIVAARQRHRIAATADRHIRECATLTAPVQEGRV
jgi:hypothetical protein